MYRKRAYQRLCQSCSSQLLYIFESGFCTTTKLSTPRRELWRHSFGPASQARHVSFRMTPSRLQENIENTRPYEPSKASADIAAIVHQARQTFGDTLPLNFLSSEEYRIYERLYGPPLDVTSPERIRVLQDMVAREEGKEERNILYKEDEEGNLEEVEYGFMDYNAGLERPQTEEGIPGDNVNRFDEGMERDPMEGSLSGEGDLEEIRPEEAAGGVDIDAQQVIEVDDAPTAYVEDFQVRLTRFREIAAANRLKALDGEQNSEIVKKEENDEHHSVDNAAQDEGELVYDEVEPSGRGAEEELDEDDDDYERGDALRTHPMTIAARSGTSPSTLQLPKDTVVEPVMSLLRDASNKHLKEIAHKIFGGAGLPNSTATPSTAGRHLQQAPLALEASQRYMGDMEANVYLAAIMPGAYASIMHTLVEVRKRLGSKWLQGLMKKEGGPRILDAGTAGAGVQAWREVLRAEWISMHPEGEPRDKPAPIGKATVVTGSNELRHRVSKLLENTTFLPRLPDYNPSRDHPTKGHPTSAQPRNQYDIIIAPHTLWGLREDYMRKNQVENFWSLLHPQGGVLVIIEKGVPRGFELVAAAREMLLKRRIASTALTQSEPLEDGDLKYGPKEKGMIIAPCTNHAQCPMYTTPGKSTGRKDLCHFSQRFIRPRYLQTILDSRDRNHEDIRFSYIAVQRGVDQRDLHSIIQGNQARDTALAGYENLHPVREEEHLGKGVFDDALPHTLELPRTILHPIKRRGHVVLDLCTPAGRIERWTVPKSFSKQAYRDARKSQWGDLWALGAKTAIARNIRLGTKDKKAKGKDVYEIDAGPSSTDDITHISGPKAKFEKRTKRGRVQKRRKKLTEDDFS